MKRVNQVDLSVVPDVSIGTDSLYYQVPSWAAKKAIAAKLTGADWCVWSYLQMLDTDNSSIPSTKEIAEAVDVSEKQVNRSIQKLGEIGILNEVLTKFFKKAEYSDPERQVRDKLKNQLGGQAEVVTLVGRIDLLTDTEIIEVKQVSEWKAALGQILSYSSFFPEHIKRIHLFGDCSLAKKQMICSAVSDFGVITTFEEGVA